jgi:alpha-tubulin suppressor-like RCC1 family protein
MRFTAIAAGWYHTCALAESGEAYCWGSNEFGQLGDGTRTSRAEPTVVDSGGLTFSTITTKATRTCGVTTSGDVYCWGESSTVPVKVVWGWGG